MAVFKNQVVSKSYICRSQPKDDLLKVSFKLHEWFSRYFANSTDKNCISCDNEANMTSKNIYYYY